MAIVARLRDGEVPAGAIVPPVRVEQANASQPLAVLRAKRIVVNRKVGNHIFYALRSPRLSAAMEVLAAIQLEDAGYQGSPACRDASLWQGSPQYGRHCGLWAYGRRARAGTMSSSAGAIMG
jgi:hypothetical protein